MCNGCGQMPVKVGETILVRHPATGAELALEVVDVRGVDGELWVVVDGRRFPLYLHQRGHAWMRPADVGA